MKITGRKVLIRFTSALNAMATAWIFLIMFLMTGDVVGRVLFNHPITGTPELVKISIVGIVFMQMPHTLWIGRHIRSDMILQKVSPKNREWLELLASVAGALVFLAIFVASWPATVTAWHISEFEGEGALRVPVYPIRSLILLGSALTAVIFILQSAQSIRHMAAYFKRS